MRLDEKEIQRRDFHAELEDEAGGVLAGVSASVLTQESIEGIDLDLLRRESDEILQMVGVQRTQPTLTVVSNPTATTYEDKVAYVRGKLTESAQMVLLAARNFEGLPKETVNTLYDELIELEHRATAHKG